MSDVYLRTRAQILAARALQGRLDGGAWPVLVPACDGALKPQVSGGTTMAATAAAALADATSLTLTLTGDYHAIRGGEHFSIDHTDDEVGRRMYRITEVTGGTGSAPVVTISPPLRQAITAATVCDFATPSCPMYLESGFGLAVELGRFSTTEATFREWFNVSPAVVPVLALRALRLTPAEIDSGSIEDTLVGALSLMRTGSTLSLVDDAGGKFKLTGTSIYAGATATDYATATSHTITVRETLSTASNSPRDTVLTIAVLATIATDLMTLAFTNPGFETGDMTGWTASSATVQAKPAGFAADNDPRTGSYFGYAGTVTPTTFYEEFDVSSVATAIDTGNVTLENLAAYHATYDPQTDQGRLEVTFLDSDGVTISIESNAYTHPNDWTRETFPSTAVPVGTRAIRLGVRNVRITGTSNDNYWDDFEDAKLVLNP